MPDRDGAMTMSEIIEAWSKDKLRVKELEGEHALLLAHCNALEAEVDNLKAIMEGEGGTEKVNLDARYGTGR